MPNDKLTSATVAEIIRLKLSTPLSNRAVAERLRTSRGTVDMKYAYYYKMVAANGGVPLDENFAAELLCGVHPTLLLDSSFRVIPRASSYTQAMLEFGIPSTMQTPAVAPAVAVVPPYQLPQHSYKPKPGRKPGIKNGESKNPNTIRERKMRALRKALTGVAQKDPDTAPLNSGRPVPCPSCNQRVYSSTIRGGMCIRCQTEAAKQRRTLPRLESLPVYDDPTPSGNIASSSR